MSEIPGQSGHALPSLQQPVCANKRHADQLTAHSRKGYLYRGSLQLFASENSACSRSLPQIFFPALLGCC